MSAQWQVETIPNCEHLQPSWDGGTSESSELSPGACDFLWSGLVFANRILRSGDLFVLLKRRLKAGMVLGGAAVAVSALAAPTATAFYPQFHESITRNALPAEQVDNLATLEILGDPSVGAGAVGSDVFASDDWRHFDNAANPAEICTRATDAWNFFTPIILQGAQAAGPDGTDLLDGPSARSAFGGLAHALQDFYSHTNWVEGNVAANTPEALAVDLFPTCDPATLPPQLFSGFFSLDFGTEGCPPGGPPPGFPECHSTLNKDGFTTPKGGQFLPQGFVVPGVPLLNYFDLASLLATKATTDLYYQVRTTVVDNVNGSGGNGECVANNLFRAELHEACGSSVGPATPSRLWDNVGE